MLSLKEIYLNATAYELEAIDRINSHLTDPIQSKADKEMLWYYNEQFGLNAFFLEHDLNMAKQYFFNCGRIDEYLIKEYGERILDYGINHFTYALLSDNLALINRYAELTYPTYHHTIKKGSLTHAMQNILKDDWKGVEQDIEIFQRLVATDKGKVYMPDLMYFKGVINRDEAFIADAICLLIKDHKKRNKHMGIAQDYLSIPALTYAKLAWLKGIEVNIEHPLVPIELLPYQPLSKYEDKYDFLK